jgi:hypothetical protein
LTQDVSCLLPQVLEVERRASRQDDVPAAEDQPDSCQISDRTFDPIALGELAGILSHLPKQVRKPQRRRPVRKDLGEDQELVAEVLAFRRGKPGGPLIRRVLISHEEVSAPCGQALGRRSTACRGLLFVSGRS